ncbi:MAG: branched-chain amino acid ABC transporter permease [Thermodesulfobacteriota bacterium]
MRRVKAIFLIALIIGLIAAPGFLPRYLLHSMILVCNFVVMASSWNLLGGYVGLTSFGQAAFYGLGAYTAAVLAINHLAPFPLTLLLGGVAAALFAALIGYPFIKLRGGYFALGMLGLAEILHVYFYNEDLWLKSSRGLSLPIITDDIRLFYYLILGLTLASLLVMYWIPRSWLGMGFIALREDEDAARMCGIQTNRYLMYAFVISAFFPGVMGAFYSHYVIYIEASDVFNIVISEAMLVMAIFGGLGTFLGPIVGAVFIYILGEIVRSTWSSYGHLIVYSLVLMVVCLFFPGGVMGLLRGEVRVPWWLKSRRT